MLKIGIVFVGLAIGALLLVSFGQQRRRSALEQAATPLGFRYDGDASESAAASWRLLPSIAARQRNFFSHVMTSGDAAIFDWTWRDGWLKERNREVQTVVALQRFEAALPAFVWTHRGATRGMPTPAMGESLRFPDEPAFSDRFDVAGPDRDALRARFDAERRGRLVLPEGLQVEGEGEWLVGFYPGRRVEPGELEELLRAMRAIAAILLD